MTDSEAGDWGEVALTEIASGRHFRPLGPKPEQHAFDLLAEVCDVLAPDQVSRLVSLAEPLIGRHPPSSAAIAKILVSLAPRRSDVQPMLMRAVADDERMAGTILNNPHALNASRDTATRLLAPHAATSRLACLALIRAGADPAPVLDLATAEVTRALQPRNLPQQLTVWAGAAQTATLASVLDPETRSRCARTMLERALDKREVTWSRRDDLKGLATIAGFLNEDTSTALLPAVLEIAWGKHDGGPADVVFGSTATLTGLGLECAVRLQPSPAQCAEIEEIAIRLLRDANESEHWGICMALSFLPARHSRLDYQQCAVHPLAGLRALSAVHWAADPAVLSGDTAQSLARDKEHRVRLALASALRRDRARDMPADISQTLRADPRRSVRRLGTLPDQPPTVLPSRIEASSRVTTRRYVPLMDPHLRVSSRGLGGGRR